MTAVQGTVAQSGVVTAGGFSIHPRTGTVARTLELALGSSLALVTVTVIDPVTIDLTFSGPPKVNDDLTDPCNYCVKGATTPDREVLSVTQQSTQVIRLSIEEMRDSVTYTATVANLKDSSNLDMLQGDAINRKNFTGVGEAPVASKVTPTGTTGVSRVTDIVIEVTDGYSGVDLSTLVITVEGDQAFNAGTFGASYNGPRSNFEAISGGYRVTIDPEGIFAYGQVVDIVVSAQDGAGNAVV